MGGNIKNFYISRTVLDRDEIPTSTPLFSGWDLDGATIDNVRHRYQWKIQDGGGKTNDSRMFLHLRIIGVAVGIVSIIDISIVGKVKSTSGLS
jgi:hypothetical protein